MFHLILNSFSLQRVIFEWLLIRFVLGPSSFLEGTTLSQLLLKESKATRSQCWMELKEAVMTLLFLIFTLIVLQGLYELWSFLHFSFSISKKIPTNPWNTVLRVLLRAKVTFNCQLPRWLFWGEIFRCISLCLYVREGPLTWLIRGSQVWEMKLLVSQGRSSTPS